MQRCIYADTALGPQYPAYINLTVERDGKLMLTVRGPAKDPFGDRPFIACGDTVTVELTHERQLGLLRALLNHIAPAAAFSALT